MPLGRTGCPERLSSADPNGGGLAPVVSLLKASDNVRSEVDVVPTRNAMVPVEGYEQEIDRT